MKSYIKHKLVLLFTFLALMSISTNYLMADDEPPPIEVQIEGDGILQEGEEFDYKIINIADDPSGPAQTAIYFTNTDPVEGHNPYPTTGVACQQYIKLVYFDNDPGEDSRVMLYTDNWIEGAIDGGSLITRFTGRRTKNDTTFRPESAEDNYIHPYDPGDYDPDTDDGRDKFVVGKRPIPVSGGILGEYEDTTSLDPDDPYSVRTKCYHDEVTPIVWQVYEYYKNEPGSTYSADWYVYDYDAEPEYGYYGDPTLPDTSRSEQYKNPTDWWGFVVDKFAWDWDWSIDWNEDSPNFSHFKVDFNDPHSHPDYGWVSTRIYRTVIDWQGYMGGFPGKRNSDGYRLDVKGRPMPLDPRGLPVVDPADPSSNPGFRKAPVKEQGGRYYFEVYIYLGANLFRRAAQDYSTNRLFIVLENIPKDITQEPIVLKGPITIPAFAIYDSDRILAWEIKPRTPADYTDRLKFGMDPQGTVPPFKPVNCRQYLKITAQSNMRDSKLVFYVDNTYNGAFPQYIGRRTKDVSGFHPTLAEEGYTHLYPDAEHEHDITEEEKDAYVEHHYYSDFGKIVDGLRPDSVTGGLVRRPTYDDLEYAKEHHPDWVIYDQETCIDGCLPGTNEVAPIVWQVYKDEETGKQYADYTIYDELGPTGIDPSLAPGYEDPTDRWAFLMDKFAWDWEWAIDWVGNIGHFKVDFTDTTADPVTGWIPNSGYRTILDYWGNLGSFPGKREDGQDGHRIDADGDGVWDPEVMDAYPPAPIYLFMGAHFYGKHSGTYETERIFLRYE